MDVLLKLSPNSWFNGVKSEKNDSLKVKQWRCHQSQDSNQSSLCSRLSFPLFPPFKDTYWRALRGESRNCHAVFQSHVHVLISCARGGLRIWVPIRDLPIAQGCSSEAMGVRQTWTYILALSWPLHVLRTDQDLSFHSYWAYKSYRPITRLRETIPAEVPLQLTRVTLASIAMSAVLLHAGVQMNEPPSVPLDRAQA